MSIAIGDRVDAGDDTGGVTLINDGQTRWYADTTDLIDALVRLGWQADVYQG